MTEVRIMRYPDDPLKLVRLSIGGTDKIGFYCVYRGTRVEAVAALEKILMVMKFMPEQEIEPYTVDPENN